MPSVMQIRRMEEFREYFRQKWAGRVTDWEVVKQDMLDKNPWLNKDRWPNLRTQLKKINDESVGRRESAALVPAVPVAQHEDNGQVMEIPTLTLPRELSDEARECINRLLEENHRLSTDISLKEMEMGGQKQRLAGQEARVRLLKKIAFEAIDAL